MPLYVQKTTKNVVFVMQFKKENLLAAKSCHPLAIFPGLHTAELAHCEKIIFLYIELVKLGFFVDV